MADLNELLKDLELKLANAASAEENLAAAKGAVSTARDAVQKAVKAGKSTGDHVRDFVLRKGYDEKEYERYQALNDAVVDKAGELMVGLYRTEDMTKHVFGGRGSEYETNYRLIVGILTGKALRFEKVEKRMCCVLPLRQWSEPLDHRVFVQGEHLSTKPFHEGIWLHEPIGAFYLVDSETRFAPRQHCCYIIAGNDAVAAWVGGDKFGDYSLGSRAWDRERAKLPKGQKPELNTPEQLNAAIIDLLREWGGELQLTPPPEGVGEEVVE